MVVTKHAEDRLRECGMQPERLVRQLGRKYLPDGEHPFFVDGTGELRFVIESGALVTVIRPTGPERFLV